MNPAVAQQGGRRGFCTSVLGNKNYDKLKQKNKNKRTSERSTKSETDERRADRLLAFSRVLLNGISALSFSVSQRPQSPYTHWSTSTHRDTTAAWHQENRGVLEYC